MKNKRIDHIRKIMSKPHGIFTEHFTVFKCRKSWKRAGVTRN